MCCDESTAEKLGKRGEVHAKNAVSLQNDDELLSSSNNGSTSEPTVGRFLFTIENNVKINDAGVFTQHKGKQNAIVHTSSDGSPHYPGMRLNYDRRFSSVDLSTYLYKQVVNVF